MAALLVTGGAGFIGTNFLYYLCRPQGGLNLSITVLDALHYAGRKERLQPLIDAGRIKFIRGDICDQTLVASILQRERIDTVVNFAAHTHVDRSIADPAPFYRNNVEGVCTLLTACCQYFLDEGHGGRFHQISTDEVYGTLSPDAPAWTEESPLDPSSPYSASKASADHFVSAFARTYGLQASISRCSLKLNRRFFSCTVLVGAGFGTAFRCSRSARSCASRSSSEALWMCAPPAST